MAMTLMSQTAKKNKKSPAGGKENKKRKTKHYCPA